MLRNARIRTRLWVMMAIPLVLVLVATAVVAVVLAQVRIGSDRYQEIIQAKDLVADVLPPPEYIVETHLTVNQLAVGAGDEQASLERLDRLEREFDTRHQVWVDSLDDPATRQAMLVDAYEPAQEYFQVLDAEFLPALEAGDTALAQELATGRLDDLYAAHRLGVDQVVLLATAAQAEAEAAAARDERRGSAVLVAVAVGLLLVAALVGVTTVRSVNRRTQALVDTATHELPRVVAEVTRSAAAGEDIPEFVPLPVAQDDELADAERAFNAVLGTAVHLAAEQSRLRRTTSQTFINLGRRNHKLLSRTLGYITDLERSERDPQTLQNLFRLDHLITRMRRNAESVLVLAGAAPMRTWSRPVPLDDVLRAALSEVESYDRVVLSTTPRVGVAGPAVSDVAHLLAELLENATTCSSPETQVVLECFHDEQGLIVCVRDDGIGLDEQQLRAANARLSMTSQDLQDSRRLGLSVVAHLAARHGIGVRLDPGPSGGVVAVVWLPGTLLQAVAADTTPQTPEPPSLTPPAPRQADQQQALRAAPEPALLTAQQPVLPPVPEQSRHRTQAPGPGGFTKRVRGQNLPQSVATTAAAADPAGPVRTAEEVKSSLAGFAAGQRAAGLRTQQQQQQQPG